MNSTAVRQELIPNPVRNRGGNGLTLGPRASFWVAASVVVHTLWTSAAPAMTYPLYASEWHLTPVVTTGIFAVYPLMVVSVLLSFGDISDYIGRRIAMLLGLGASLVGVLLFAIAPNVYWIFVGRAFMGVGVGLSAAPSAAAMVEFSPAGQSGPRRFDHHRCPGPGLALAMLVGGALIAYAPLPTRLNFWVLFVFLAMVFSATWFLPASLPEPSIRALATKTLYSSQGTLPDFCHLRGRGHDRVCALALLSCPWARRSRTTLSAQEIRLSMGRPCRFFRLFQG